MNRMFNLSRAQWIFSLAMLTAAAVLASFGHIGAAIMIAPGAVVDLEAAVTEVKRVASEIGAAKTTLEEQFKELKGRFDKGEALPKELKESIDKALTEFNGFKGEMNALEQKLLDRKGDQPEAAKTWGEQFADSDTYKDLKTEQGSFEGNKKFAVGAKMEAKQVNSAAAGGLIQSYREPGVLNLLRERFTMRDLLSTVRISTSSVDYAVQTTRTNNAAPVAEGTAKPYSDYAWSKQSVVVKTLAHLAKITRQAMDDAPRLVGEIDSEMRYGLGYVEERQFLFGNNTGENLHGIMPQAQPFAVPVGFDLLPADPGVTRIDVLRVAMLQNAIALLPADGIVLNQVDWAIIELTKTKDGAYLFANPQGQVGARMWGLPVVDTTAMTIGSFLVGAFKQGATIYDRMAVEVLISTENTDDFEKNLATMRAEERLALAVKRPQAFTKGVFADAITALTAP